MAFVKLDCGILRSTTWLDKDCRDVFLTALLMAEPREYAAPICQLQTGSLEPAGWAAPAGWYGYVAASGPGIIDAAKVDVEKGRAALERLGAPEPESRSQDFDGRRMIRIDGGYLILNFVKYRERDHTAAERTARWRQRKKEEKNNVTTVTLRRDVTSHDRSVTQAEAEAEGEIRSTGRDPDPERPPASARLTPVSPARRVSAVGAVSIQFLRCFDRYVNPYRKQQAAQTFQELAEQTNGGEVGLADAICAAFDAGLLKRHPYGGEARFRPKFETFLAERMWEEKAPASTDDELRYPKL